MTRRQALLLVTVCVLLAASLLVAAPAGGQRSVTDRTPRGYRAAYATLEAAGADVGVWEAPFTALLADGAAEDRDPPPPPGTTLVVAFPVARGFEGGDDATALLRWVRDGNRAVLLLDPASDPPFTLVEGTLKALVTRDEPTAPWAWGEWRVWTEGRRSATFARGASAPGAVPDANTDAPPPLGTLSLADPEWILSCPPNADALATSADGSPRACRVPWGDGELVLVSDATVWQNDHLARADNLAFLAELLGGRPVRFDEWHHAVVVTESPIPRHVPALFAAHLLAIWLLGLLALAHRFGDALPTPTLAGPSMGRALHALATLHRGSGHAPAAAARLYALLRARAARRGVDPDTLPPPPARPSDAAFAAWAARAAKVQEEGRF